MAFSMDDSRRSDSRSSESRSGVVITGVGVVSPIGIGCESYWTSLNQLRSGVEQLPHRADVAIPLQIGGTIKDFDGKLYVKPRKSLKVMSREIQTGFSAAALAVEQSGLQSDQLVPERLGVVFGSEMLYCEPQEMLAVYQRCIEKGQFHFDRWGAVFMSEMYPLWMLMYLPNMIACHVGIAHDARGPNNTICQGEASSLLALIEAVTIIQRGGADVMIVGGSSSRLSMSPMLYRGIAHLSSQVDPPQQACRPFDATRDGTVNGEGAAAFVLESEEYARDRGAKVLTHIRGWGLSFAAKENGNAAHGRAISRSIELALERADLRVPEVGHVNAHAGGLIVDDRVEAQAIQRVLGAVPVTAPKSFFGNLGSSGGAVEMVASIQTLLHGKIPATLNYTQPDPQCPVQVVHGEAIAAQQPTALVLSQSGTGHAIAVALEAGEC